MILLCRKLSLIWRRYNAARSPSPHVGGSMLLLRSEREANCVPQFTGSVFNSQVVEREAMWV